MAVRKDTSTSSPRFFRALGGLVIVGSCSILAAYWLLVGYLVALTMSCLLVPLIAAAFLVLVRRPGTEDKKPTNPGLQHRTWILFLLATFVLIEILSVAIRLTSSERTLQYFITQWFSIVIIAIQITMLFNPSSLLRLTLLLEIGVYTSLQLAMKTLVFEYYVGNTDVAYHAEWTSWLTATGHVGTFMGTYSYYPVMHVISSTLQQVLGGCSSIDAIHILFCVSGFIMPFTVHSVASRFSSNKKMILALSFLAASGYSFLAFMSEGMPYVLAFVIFTYVVLFAVGKFHGSRIAIIVVLFVTVLVLTHQVSIPYMIAFLVIGILLSRDYGPIAGFRTRRSLRFVAAFFTIYIAYSVICSINFYGRLFFTMDLPSEGSAGILPMESPASLISVLADMIARLPLYLLIFLAFLGIFYVLVRVNPGPLLRHKRILFFLGMASVFSYIPGAVSRIPLIQTYLLAGTRHQLFSEQIVMTFAAITLFKYEGFRHSQFRKTAIALTLAVVIFGGCINELGTGDTRALADENPKPRLYFTAEHLSVVTEMYSWLDGGTILTDFVTSRLLDSHGISTRVPSLNTNTSVWFNQSSMVLLDVSQLDSNALYFLYPTYGQKSGVETTVLAAIDYDPFLEFNNVLFDSGQLVLVEVTYNQVLGEESLTTAPLN